MRGGQPLSSPLNNLFTAARCPACLSTPNLDCLSKHCSHLSSPRKSSLTPPASDSFSFPCTESCALDPAAQMPVELSTALLTQKARHPDPPSTERCGNVIPLIVLERPPHMETNFSQSRQKPKASLNTAGGGWWPVITGYDNAASWPALVLKVHGFSGSHKGQDHGIHKENHICTPGLKGD